PVPVSPVSTVNPSAKSTDDSSISTSPRMSSARSTALLQVAVLLEYFAPAQLLAQRGEVAVARRVHEAHRVRRALEQQAVALLHVGERKAVEMRARVERAHQHDLDHHAVAHAYRARGKGVRVERHQRERRHRAMPDRMSSWPMSVMKPTRPWFTPTRGTWWRTRLRAAASIVPSPPTTIASLASAPIAA